jgi:hypothetical protein
MDLDDEIRLVEMIVARRARPSAAADSSIDPRAKEVFGGNGR